MEIRVRNVNHALPKLVKVFAEEQVPMSCIESRVGRVLSIDEPVTVTYERPWECVLFNRQRDANPFFHLFEALWMLAGRNDVAPLAFYNSKIGEIASDDGKTFNGPYGYRWRNARAIDQPTGCMGTLNQLDVIVDHLKAVPNSRRAVLQIWNVEDDLLKMETSKDLPCNTHVYFRIQSGKLEMTVCNRSNDLLWGMIGANAVHFAFLQEYMAARIGVQIGCYRQITNNLHVYTNRKDWQPKKILAECDEEGHWYEYAERDHFPLVENPKRFDEECAEFVSGVATFKKWDEPFLDKVAFPMYWSFALHKKRGYNMALESMKLVEAEDWRIAGTNWLTKRKERWEKKVDW